MVCVMQNKDSCKMGFTHILYVGDCRTIAIALAQLIACVQGPLSPFTRVAATAFMMALTHGFSVFQWHHLHQATSQIILPCHGHRHLVCKERNAKRGCEQAIRTPLLQALWHSDCCRFLDCAIYIT